LSSWTPILNKSLPIDGAAQLQRVAGLGHRVFETACAIEEDDLFIGPNPAIDKCLFVSGIGRRTFGQSSSPSTAATSRHASAMASSPMAIANRRSHAPPAE